MNEVFPYNILSKQEIIAQINYFGGLHNPFLFIVDFKAECGYVISAEELDEKYVQFHFETQNSEQETRNETPCHRIGVPDQVFDVYTEHETRNTKHETLHWNIKPISILNYRSKFDYVFNQIHLGNSFLTNLTQPTEIDTNYSLKELFDYGTAKYKLWIKNQFVVLSPETFVQINGQIISSFPMKGTIDAKILNADKVILNDPKEIAEHATIVDLIRNDLSLVANQVHVKRYRYIEKISTNKQNLLQVSSEISGRLPDDFHQQLGDIIFALLPAGSICGAPKSKTLEIIDRVECYKRGFYTGICGYFDGENLDSAVMIRFIEQGGEKLFFKSGGGITSQSEMTKEYEELIQKVYVPIS